MGQKIGQKIKQKIRLRSIFSHAIRTECHHI